MDSEQNDKVWPSKQASKRGFSGARALVKSKIPAAQTMNCSKAALQGFVREVKKMSFREFFELLGVNILVSFRNAIEFFKVVARYYHSRSFRKADLSLRLMYLFHNPFSISKRFLMKKGEEEIYAYGETPLTSLEIIARESQIGPHDCVFELGAGRGRSCFWLNSFIGCSVVGIEYVPEFVERANRIKKRLRIQGVDFRLEDFTHSNLQGATVCYLYGTCLDDETIKKLAQTFSKLPVGTKIITVSYPLSDYAEHPTFKIMKRFVVPYTWGETDVFVQVVSK